MQFIDVIYWKKHALGNDLYTHAYCKKCVFHVQ